MSHPTSERRVALVRPVAESEASEQVATVFADIKQTLGEVLAIVSLFNSTNALANGYRIEPDVVPSWD